MAKNHMMRVAAPKTMQIQRKTHKFITRSSPGPHPIKASIPLNTLMKEMLSLSTTTRETKKILHTNEMLIDGIRRVDVRFPVGLFDTIDFKGINEQYRVLLNTKGKLELVKIKQEETGTKPCKIINKTMVKGKVQLNLYDGKNVTVDKDSYKVGDSLLLSLPDQKISKHLKLDKKASILLVGGKHTGETGVVEDIIKNKIIYKDHHGNLVETSKEYAFVVGDAKPLVTLQ